jgi:hypothetical protein
MTQLSNVFAGVLHVAEPPDTVSRLREDWRVARAAPAELVRLGTPRVNLMLMGPNGVLEYFLDALLPDLREPVGRWCPGEQLLLPPPALIGTMIFQDVGAMPQQDQRRLLEWLAGASGRTQVVSTTPTCLLPLVEAGAFSADLYYRLNIVRIDATA